MIDDEGYIVCNWCNEKTGGTINLDCPDFARAWHNRGRAMCASCANKEENQVEFTNESEMSLEQSEERMVDNK